MKKKTKQMILAHRHEFFEFNAGMHMHDTERRKTEL